MSNQLGALYADYVGALSHLPLGKTLLTEILLPSGSERLSTMDLLNRKPTTSVQMKLDSGTYNFSVYALYHDLKLAAARLLIQHPVGSRTYNDIYSFFRFAADLLLREASRLGLMKPSGPGNIGDSFLQTISVEIERIFADMDEYYGEAFYILAQNGPLFSSTNGKASFDPRDTKIGGAVHTTKLLPYITKVPDVVLGQSCPANGRLLHPAVPPTELLSHMTTPVATPVVATRWIKNDVFKSFAPTQDGTGALAPVEYATALWYEKAVSDFAAKASPQAPKEEISVNDVRKAANQAPQDLLGANPTSHQPDQEPGVNLGQNTLKLRNPQAVQHQMLDKQYGDLMRLDDCSIDVAALLDWSPANFVDDDELEAAAQGTEIQLVSRLLLELQFRQRERLGVPGMEYLISEEERHTAFKIQNILCRLIGDAEIKDINLPISSKLPVLMRNYMGALPSMESKPEPARLASVSSGMPDKMASGMYGMSRQKLRK